MKSDARKAKTVDLRYFGGLNVEETAAILNVSLEIVTRGWRRSGVGCCRKSPAEASREATAYRLR
jgi:hypothetical protein